MTHSSPPPTAFFFCGLTGSGKSTLARFLEHALPARRYSVDEEMRAHSGLEVGDEGFGALARETRERFWELGLDALGSGRHVLFDWNLWSRARRAEWTARATEAGYPHVLLFLDIPLADARTRLGARNTNHPERAHVIPVAELERFAMVFERPGGDENLNVVTIDALGSVDAVLAALRRHGIGTMDDPRLS